MLCPQCRQPLVIVEYRDIELDACPDCHGLWFDAQELQQMFEMAGAGAAYHKLEDQLDRFPHSTPRRRCPRCRSRLEPVRAPSVKDDLILDECPYEHGIWFDAGELEALLRASLGSEQALEEVRGYLGLFMAPAKSAGEAER